MSDAEQTRQTSISAKCFVFCGLVGAASVFGACASAQPGTIGAALGQQSDHHVYLRAVPPGEGADKAGLLVDDEVVALDGKPVATMTPDDIRRAVRGDVGTTLTVTILRGGDKRDIKVTRTPLLAAKPK